MKLIALSVALMMGLGAYSACGWWPTADGDADDEHFDTFQACYDDHLEEKGDPATAAAICCLDHPIGTNDANVVCGDTQAACETYVTANTTGVEASAITTACSKYITERGMQ